MLHQERQKVVSAWDQRTVRKLILDCATRWHLLWKLDFCCFNLKNKANKLPKYCKYFDSPKWNDHLLSAPGFERNQHIPLYCLILLWHSPNVWLIQCSIFVPNLKRHVYNNWRLHNWMWIQKGKRNEYFFMSSSSSSTSSSCRTISTDIPDPLLPPFLIIHCLQQVFRATFRIGTELLYVGLSWSPCLCSSM